MRENYLSGERNSVLNVASLNLMQRVVSDRAWGSQLGTFSLIAIRACLRVEYHALNVYKALISLVESHEGILLGEGEIAVTGEENSKYEIEAFLAASKTLMDIHLDKKDALLKRKLGSDNIFHECFSKVFNDFSYLFSDGSIVNIVRNSSVHNKNHLKDCGFTAGIENGPEGLRVIFPNLYSIEEQDDLDLVKIFCKTSSEMSDFIRALVSTMTVLMDMLKNPEQTCYLHRDSWNWRVIVSYGPAGFTEKSFLLKEVLEMERAYQQSATVKQLD